MPVFRALIKIPIHIYRWTLKPIIGLECRHEPTCSAYALEAIDTNGAWKGFWLTVSRLSRCHPWGTHGYDPPPDLRAVSYPFQPWRYGRWGRKSVPAAEERRTLVLKEIYSDDGAHRVVILRHPSGLYGFDEEEKCSDDGAAHWHPMPTSSPAPSFAMCDTPETAEREARARVSWLAEKI